MDNNNNHNQRQGVALCHCIINNILYTCIACLTLHMVPINNASIVKTRPTYARGKLEACGEMTSQVTAFAKFQDTVPLTALSTGIFYRSVSKRVSRALHWVFYWLIIVFIISHDNTLLITTSPHSPRNVLIENIGLFQHYLNLSWKNGLMWLTFIILRTMYF